MNGVMAKTFASCAFMTSPMMVRLSMTHVRTSLQSRTLFHNAFLKSEQFQRDSSRHRLFVNDVHSFKESLASKFQTSGSANIFQEDLWLLIHLADNEQDAQLASSLLRRLIQERVHKVSLKAVSSFFFLCMSQGYPHLAMNFWRDPLVRDSGILDISPAIQLRYYSILYKAHHFEDLISDFEAEQAKNNVSPDVLTVVMAALCHLGNDEAFEKAKKLIASSELSLPAALRIQKCLRDRKNLNVDTKCIFALFAFKKGQYGIALDSLQESRPTSAKASILQANLEVAILTQIERLDEALLIIRRCILQSNREITPIKSFVASEVMQGLSDSIKTRVAKAPNDPSNSQLLQEFTDLCKEMDSQTVLSKSSLEELFLFPNEDLEKGIVSESEEK